MDMAKFIDLLEHKTLFFSRSDKLEDQFEGSITYNRLKLEKAVMNINYLQNSTISSTNSKKSRENFYINCWHKRDHESFAMWQIYGKSTKSIAIVSKVKQLKKVLLNHNEINKGLEIEQVYYIDYQKDDFEVIPVKHYRFFHKLKAFNYEHEVRAVIEFLTENDSSQKIEFSEMGITVSVNLNRLINEIVISPFAPLWFQKLIEDLVNIRYNLKKTVSYSVLEKSPIFGV